MTATSKLQQLGYLLHHGIDDDDAFWQMTPRQQVQDARYVRAVREYQFANAAAIDPLIGTYYPDRSAAVVHADGILGPATGEALNTHQWCGTEASRAMPAAGDKPWPCHRDGITFSVDWDGLGSEGGRRHLPVKNWARPVYEAAIEKCLQDCRATGRVFRQVAYHGTEIENVVIGFVDHPPGWIGLGLFPPQWGTCDTWVWSLINMRWRPYSNFDKMVNAAVPLFHHEIFSGHNMSLEHETGTRRDWMYPAINTDGTWDGLPTNVASYRTLGNRFDLTPIPDNPQPEPPVSNWWNKYRLSDAGGNRYVFAEIQPGQSVTGFELTDPGGKTVEIREVS